MLRKLTPHAVIIISAMYFLFFFIDRVNSAMGFINNRITKRLLFALCVLAVYQAVLLIRDNRRRERSRRERHIREQRRQDPRRREAARPGQAADRYYN